MTETVDDIKARIMKLRDEKLRELTALHNRLVGLDTAIAIVAEIEDRPDDDEPSP